MAIPQTIRAKCFEIRANILTVPGKQAGDKVLIYRAHRQGAESIIPATSSFFPDAATRERALATLERYVRAETPTGDRAGIAILVGALATRYRELGATTQLHQADGGAHLVADLPGAGLGMSGPRVLLVGHADTVWPRGTIDSGPVWASDGERVTGPGVYDMKSGLVVIEEALALTRDSRDRLPIRIIVTADEEIGSPSSRELLLAAAGGCAVAIGFESPHPDGSLKVGRLGSVRVRLAVTGRSAHAALDPERGISAVEELLDQLITVRTIVADARAATSQEVLYNLGSVESTGKTNVVSAHATADLGFRFSGIDSESQVLSAMDSLVAVRPGAVISVERLSHRPTWTPRAIDVALAERLSRVADADLRHAPAAGAADTNFLGRLGLAVVDGMGPRGGGAHASSEHTALSSLWERMSLLATFLCDVDHSDATGTSSADG